MKDIIIFLFSIILFSSCLAIDHKPLGYWIHNNTEDTLLIDMTESDTLSDGAQWFFSPTDTLILDKEKVDLSYTFQAKNLVMSIRFLNFVLSM